LIIYEKRGWLFFYTFDGKYNINMRKRITGKYLLFSADLELLITIAKKEINDYGFNIAKVPIIDNKFGIDYVLCLYWNDNSRLNELQKRYLNIEKLSVVNWKTQDDSLQNKYSDRFLNSLTDKEKEIFISLF
jgi:hypothetical protein